MAAEALTGAEGPPELDELVRRVEGGERPKVRVRTLLSWFGLARRGALGVARIDGALRSRGLATQPDFADAWQDDEIEVVPRSGRPAPAPPTVSGVQPAPAAEAPAQAVVVEASHPSPAPVPVQEPVTPALTGPARDPVHRIGALAAANRELAWVGPGTTMQSAMTTMEFRGLSRLVVSTAEAKRCWGVVTWRSVARAFAAGKGSEQVTAFVESADECSADDDVFEVARQIERAGFVVVRNKGVLRGPIDWADLTDIFGAQLEPFVLAGEVEVHLRALIAAKAPEALEGSSPGATRTAGLTLGECQRIVQEPTHWTRLGLPFDRATFDAELGEVRLIRNDLMHFNPDGVDQAKVRRLRSFVVALREALGSRRAAR